MDLVDWADVAALRILAIRFHKSYGWEYPVNEAIDFTSRPGPDLDEANNIAETIREAVVFGYQAGYREAAEDCQKFLNLS